MQNSSRQHKKPEKKQSTTNSSKTNMPGAVRMGFFIIIVGVLVLVGILGRALATEDAAYLRDLANNAYGALTTLVIMAATRFFKIGE